MARLSVVRASVLFFIAAGVAAVSALGSTGASSGAGQSAFIALIAVDGDISGNAARTVGSIEQSVSACVGQPVDIDIVIPSPGIPADRGMAAYQFSILYDPTVVWIDADNSDMLLAQAAGSKVIPIADPKPDSNGVYQSWGVDFGSSGIEPVGSSETGPGVITRITLLPQTKGVSPLILSNVLIIDDGSERIGLESIQSATIDVDQPCPGRAQTSARTPTPTAAPSTPSPAAGMPTPTPAPSIPSPAASAPTPTPDYSTPPPDDGTSAPARGTPAVMAFSAAGGPPPPPASGTPVWLVLWGLIATLGGAGLLISGRSAFRARTRRDTSPQQD